MATEVVLVLTSPPGGAVSGALANSFSTGLLPQNLLTNKGDLLTSDGTELKKLSAAGADGKFLTANSGAPLGIEWATVPPSGDVTGPGVSIDGNIALFDGTDGKVIKEAELKNGELLIGSTGAAPVAATITGTANQIDVKNAAGSITLSTPQDIAQTSSPTFAGLSTSGFSMDTGAGAGYVLRSDSSGVASWSNINQYYTSLPLFSSDITSMYAFPILVVGTPGTGRALMAQRMAIVYTDDVKYTGAGTVTLQYGPAPMAAGPVAAQIGGAVFTSGGDRVSSVAALSVNAADASTIVDKPFYVTNGSAAYAAGTGTAVLHLWYSIA